MTCFSSSGRNSRVISSRISRMSGPSGILLKSMSVSRRCLRSSLLTMLIIARTSAPRNARSFNRSACRTARSTSRAARALRCSCTAQAAKSASSGRPVARSCSATDRVRQITRGTSSRRVPRGPVTSATVALHRDTVRVWVITSTSPITPVWSCSIAATKIHRRRFSGSSPRCTSTTSHEGFSSSRSSTSVATVEGSTTRTAGSTARRPRESPG